MSTYDARLATLEKDAILMKQDIIYKLDDTNTAVTMIQGVVGVQGRDLKYIINQVKGIDIRLEGLTQEVRAMGERQHSQGQDIKDIKHRLDGVDQRLDGLDRRLTSLEEKFDQRFEQFDQRFEQVLQVLTTLTNKAE
jgi:chromosome segregation ATPase